MSTSRSSPPRAGRFETPHVFVSGASAVSSGLLETLGAQGSRAEIHLVWSGVRKRFGKASAHGRISSFRDVYSLPAVERDALVRAGVPAEFAELLVESMGIAKERFYRILNLSRSTLERKLHAKADMSTPESERVIGLAKLIGQVEAMVSESGDATGFDAAKWFAAWSAEPSAALGGRRPEDLLETADGRDAVSKLLAQMQSGAFA